MTVDEKIAMLRKLFHAFGSTGDVTHLLEQLTDDAVYKVSIGPGTPLSGEFVGKEGIAGYFRDMHTGVEHLALNVHDFFANEHKAVVLGDETLRTTVGGVVFFTEWATVFTFRGDLISHVLVIENLGALSQALGVPHASPPAATA
ncbi:nuclear transport factor 2 family protein [Chondromyces apiculatus]|uniref:SnoaL-like domain-containing protein n=1 Tax=Chondromyces apiculatus DSM 436 TaxID=1192034 RepID=A0A017SU38_9BACT|nr:nuclear transport factor 2 family protein [Chondromyces apiculatus]EYF00095.1 Hypothetical protein CAP_1379 [Chondromyces apiculatus DSM 436]